MKKPDLIKQLANRINQPHVIESWINKIEKAAYNKGIKDAESKQCNIPVVVQAKPEKVCELVRLKFDDWVFGLETQAGEKLKVVDSTDFNEIITEIENELKDLQNL